MYKFPRPSSLEPDGNEPPPGLLKRSWACESPGTQQRIREGSPSGTCCSGGSINGFLAEIRD